jgi:chromosomal replication initiation ATPase DnaA
MTPHIFAGLTEINQHLYTTKEIRYKNKPTKDEINQIIKIASESAGVYPELVLFGSRLKEVINAKRLLAYLFYERYGYSMKETATLLGLREHATIIHHIRTFRNLLEVKEQTTVNLLKTFNNRMAFIN